jgi:RNA polymerase sigma factor (sigma-70 family)
MLWRLYTVRRHKYMDEQTLISRLIGKDHEAFACLLEQYEQKVFACCYAAGLNATDAEDAAAEVFMTVWQSIHKFRQESGLGTWILKITYNTAVDILRKKGRDLHLPLENDLISSSESNDGRDYDENLWTTVARLPWPLGIVCVLFYREDKSIAEISDITKIPQNSVKVYLSRARDKLKLLLRLQIEGYKNEGR